jgi:hypothetical protein
MLSACGWLRNMMLLLRSLTLLLLFTPCRGWWDVGGWWSVLDPLLNSRGIPPRLVDLRSWLLWLYSFAEKAHCKAMLINYSSLFDLFQKKQKKTYTIRRLLVIYFGRTWKCGFLAFLMTN